MSKFGKKPIAIPEETNLPPEFWQGVQEFNAEEFYTCHDTLEALWAEASEPNRTFFQGLLQLAVACYHLKNQNIRGAVLLLGEGAHRLGNYLPDYGGLDVADLIDQAQVLQAALHSGNPDVTPTLFQIHCVLPGKN